MELYYTITAFRGCVASVKYNLEYVCDCVLCYLDCMCLPLLNVAKYQWCQNLKSIEILVSEQSPLTNSTLTHVDVEIAVILRTDKIVNVFFLR